MSQEEKKDESPSCSAKGEFPIEVPEPPSAESVTSEGDDHPDTVPELPSGAPLMAVPIVEDDQPDILPGLPPRPPLRQVSSDGARCDTTLFVSTDVPISSASGIPSPRKRKLQTCVTQPSTSTKRSQSLDRTSEVPTQLPISKQHRVSPQTSPQTSESGQRDGAQSQSSMDDVEGLAVPRDEEGSPNKIVCLNSERQKVEQSHAVSRNIVFRRAQSADVAVFREGQATPALSESSMSYTETESIDTPSGQYPTGDIDDTLPLSEASGPRLPSESISTSLGPDFPGETPPLSEASETRLRTESISTSLDITEESDDVPPSKLLQRLMGLEQMSMEEDPCSSTSQTEADQSEQVVVRKQCGRTRVSGSSGSPETPRREDPYNDEGLRASPSILAHILQRQQSSDEFRKSSKQIDVDIHDLRPPGHSKCSRIFQTRAESVEVCVSEVHDEAVSAEEQAPPSESQHSSSKRGSEDSSGSHSKDSDETIDVVGLDNDAAETREVQAPLSEPQSSQNRRESEVPEDSEESLDVGLENDAADTREVQAPPSESQHSQSRRGSEAFDDSDESLDVGLESDMAVQVRQIVSIDLTRTEPAEASRSGVQTQREEQDQTNRPSRAQEAGHRARDSNIRSRSLNIHNRSCELPTPVLFSPVPFSDQAESRMKEEYAQLVLGQMNLIRPPIERFQELGRNSENINQQVNQPGTRENQPSTSGDFQQYMPPRNFKEFYVGQPLLRISQDIQIPAHAAEDISLHSSVTLGPDYNQSGFADNQRTADQNVRRVITMEGLIENRPAPHYGYQDTSVGHEHTSTDTSQPNVQDQGKSQAKTQKKSGEPIGETPTQSSKYVKVSCIIEVLTRQALYESNEDERRSREAEDSIRRTWQQQHPPLYMFDQSVSHTAGNTNVYQQAYLGSAAAPRGSQQNQQPTESMPSNRGSLRRSRPNTSITQITNIGAGTSAASQESWQHPYYPSFDTPRKQGGTNTGLSNNYSAPGKSFIGHGQSTPNQQSGVPNTTSTSAQLTSSTHGMDTPMDLSESGGTPRYAIPVAPSQTYRTYETTPFTQIRNASAEGTSVIQRATVAGVPITSRSQQRHHTESNRRGTEPVRNIYIMQEANTAASTLPGVLQQQPLTGCYQSGQTNVCVVQGGHYGVEEAATDQPIGLQHQEPEASRVPGSSPGVGAVTAQLSRGAQQQHRTEAPPVQGSSPSVGAIPKQLSRGAQQQHRTDKQKATQRKTEQESTPGGSRKGKPGLEAAAKIQQGRFKQSSSTEHLKLAARGNETVRGVPSQAGVGSAARALPGSSLQHRPGIPIPTVKRTGSEKNVSGLRKSLPSSGAATRIEPKTTKQRSYSENIKLTQRKTEREKMVSSMRKLKLETEESDKSQPRRTKQQCSTESSFIDDNADNNDEDDETCTG